MTPASKLTLAPTLTKAPTETPVPTITPSPVPTLPDGVENIVAVNFINTSSYESPEFSFTSHEINGVSHIATHLQNTPDKSQAPVYGLGLEFKAEIEKIGSNIARGPLVMNEYPTYQWFFGEVPEEPTRDVYSSEAYIESEVGYSKPFTPKFDATISFDKTAFTDKDIQTVTITIIPRGVKDANITVHVTPQSALVDALLINPLPGEHKSALGEVISVSPDSKNLYVNDLPLRENKPYTFTFTIEVDPLISGAKYSPWISIGCGSSTPIQLETGKVTGNMFEYNMDSIGTWKWTAVGDYTWDWHGSSEVVIYNVNFGQYILDK